MHQSQHGGPARRSQAHAFCEHARRFLQIRCGDADLLIFREGLRLAGLEVMQPLRERVEGKLVLGLACCCG
jgi:hypothetical protein